VALYVIQSRFTLTTLRRDLEVNAGRIAEGIANIRQRPGHPERQRFLPLERPPSEFTEQTLRDLRVRDSVRILSPEGVPASVFPARDDVTLPLSEYGLRAAQDGRPWTEISTADGERLLVHIHPVIVDGEVTEIVQVARPLADRDRSLTSLSVTLIVGTIVTTLIAFGIGWMLSGITLRPIHRITQTAQTIGAERDFGRRVVYVGPNDEIGQLAATFNGMLTRLQAAYQQIEGTLQMQRDFLADVSHELRTPLTTIRGNLDLLGRRPSITEEEREDILADMVDESDRLIRLVNELLALARAEAGRRNQTEPVRLKALIEDVCRQVQLLQPEQPVDCHLLDDLVIQADRDALKQVLLILLDNALKHTPGPVRVTLDDRGHSVTISIHDSGPGIPPELSERIFDRFTRGDESRSTPGFGLGLSIAKALVEAQAGTIAVQSRVGRGSTFVVTLPKAGVSA
jgi:signal transduction histidine kinase